LYNKIYKKNSTSKEQEILSHFYLRNPSQDTWSEAPKFNFHFVILGIQKKELRLYYFNSRYDQLELLNTFPLNASSKQQFPLKTSVKQQSSSIGKICILIGIYITLIQDLIELSF
jgi:hypothetical protein